MNKHRKHFINAGQLKSGYKPAAIGSIPEDWEVVKFEDAILRQRIKVGKIKQQEYKKVGKCPVIDQSQSYIAGYTDEADKQYQGTLPVIIFGDHTRVFKFVDFPFVVGADGVKVT
jgi:type I restriction enzyme S subunit